MTFKEKLVILRKSKGLTQDDFASAVGVSRQAVYKWESGQSYPEVPKLLEMKILFTISIDELLDDSYDLPLPEKKKKKRAPKVENEVKTAAPKAPKTPKVAPAPKAAPVAPVAPVTPKTVSATPVAPVAPKAEPAAPVAPVAPVTPAPAPKAEPVAATVPVAQPAPAPKAEPAPSVKEESKVDTVPNPILLEDIVSEEENKAEPAKKGGFFDRLFGRR